jgi:CHAP domain-containing protein
MEVRAMVEHTTGWRRWVVTGLGGVVALLVPVALVACEQPAGCGGGTSGSGGAPVTVPGNATTFQGKVSWFGGPNDPSAGSSTASGLPVSVPGIAAHPPGVSPLAQENHDRLGGYWLIGFPNGKQVVLQQTDIGPSANGRVVDVTYSALPYAGYSESNFPTDSNVTATYLGKGSQYAQYAAGKGGNATPPPNLTQAAQPGGCSVAPGSGSRADIVRIAESQVGTHADSNECQPYGPCEDWCALFASWVWQKAGVKVPTMPGAAQWSAWGQQQNTWHPTNPQPGDVIEFSGQHVGIVESVAANGDITIIAGNAGPSPGAVIRHASVPPSDWQAMGPAPVTGYTSPPGA